MITRRAFAQAGLAASAIIGASGFGNWSRIAAQQRLTQDDLLGFTDFGNVTLVHVTDIHAQLRPIWFREPDTTVGVLRRALVAGDHIRHGQPARMRQCQALEVSLRAPSASGLGWTSRR